MRFLVDLAWRDLRASGRSLMVFCACLVLGVTLVAGTGGLYRLINAGLLADTRVLLGGDLEVDSEEPLPDRALAWMRERGAVSLVTEVDTMLGTADDEFLRVELQAMDSLYPLYGNLVLQPAQSLADATALTQGRWGAAVDGALAKRLDLRVGDDIYVGELTMRIRALVMQQPDRALSADWRGAPVLVSDAALAASGLLQAGSQADYDYRVRTTLPTDEWEQAFHASFPDEAWEVRTFEDRSRRIAERLDQLASGLLIIGFSTLFIGGLGVFNSIRAYLQGKLGTIATLRALGLRNRRLAVVYLLQIAIMSGGASVVGAALGTALALAGAGIIAAEVPFAANLASLGAPALVAVGFGLLTAHAFALPAIGHAVSVEPASLFRGGYGKAAQPRAGWRLAALACAALIVTLVVLALPDTAFGAGFVLTVGILLLLLDLVVRGIRRAARKLDDHPFFARRFALRLAVANLHRPGTPLRAALLSLGSALTLLVACTLVVAALLRTINDTIPAESPALVLYDISDRQLADVVRAIEASPGPVRVETTPLVQSRIVAINGRSLDELTHLDSEQRRDASQDDYDLSYSAGNLDDVSLAAGNWWREDSVGSPRLALEDYEAEQLDLAVGDVITFGVAGDTLTATVDGIFSQKGIQTRFWFEGIVSDGALEGFVSRHVGAAYMEDDAAVAAQRRVGAIAPNVITVRTAALLASARDILGKAAGGLAVVAGVSLLASLLVLISVMAAGRARQVYDATVLHALGTRMAVIRHSLHLEYLLLALVTSAFAILLGSAIALGFLKLRLKLPSEDLLWLGAVTALIVSSLSLWLGARYLLRRLRLQPAVLLRGAG